MTNSNTARFQRISGCAGNLYGACGCAGGAVSAGSGGCGGGEGEGKSYLEGLSWARVKLARANVAMIRSPSEV